MKNFFAVLFCLVLASGVFAQKYTIQQYLNIKSAGGPTFSPDARKLAYLTNTTGTNQVWVIDLPKGTPKQLTNYEDSVSFVRWLGDGSGIIFGKAKGGDENTQFYWMKTDGSGVRALTDEPKVRHNFAEVSGDGKKIYYASNKRDPKFFDVYVMDIAAGKEEMLYQYDGNINIAAVNDLGTKFVLSRDGVEKSLDNDLYMVDVRTKKETHLTPHADASEFGDVHFLADGIVLTTNDKREFAGLAYMRKKNPAGDDWSDANRETRIIDDQKWDVGSVAMNDYPSVMAYTVNRDGFSELYLRKIETDGKPLISVVDSKAEPIKLPAQGIVGGLTFNKDQTKLAFTFNSATQNGDIWLYDLKTKNLTQITYSDQAGIRTTIVCETGTNQVQKLRRTRYTRLVLHTAIDGCYEARVTVHFYAQVCHRKSESIEHRISSTSAFPDPGDRLRPRRPRGPRAAWFQCALSILFIRLILATNVRLDRLRQKLHPSDDVEKRENSVEDLQPCEWLVQYGGASRRKIAIIGGSYGGYMTLGGDHAVPDCGRRRSIRLAFRTGKRF